MSEQPKYVAVELNGSGLTCQMQASGHYKAMFSQDIAAALNVYDKLLNTPPQPASIVWKKPGEAGRVTGRRYFVGFADGFTVTYEWASGRNHDGWGASGVTCWAETPPVPAWATGGAA